MLVAGGALLGGLALGFAGRGVLRSASTGAKTASLSVSSKQPGIKLVVDGKDLGNLPRQVAGLAAGEHVISLEGDHYRTRRSSITLRADEVRELEPVTLEIARGAASFEVKPAGATVALVSADERRELRDWSRAVDVDNAQKWTLEASKAGYQTQRIALRFDDEFAKTFVVARSPEGAPATSAASSVVLSKAEVPRAREPRPSEAAPSAEAPTDDAPKSAATGSCTLNANSIPHSKVLVDGRPVGLTPKVGIAVPAGQHTVLFVGDNSQKSTTVTCSSGEKKTVSVRL
jgi:serine/threonine-protein kinase